MNEYVLNNSLKEHKTVTIIYLGKDNKITKRNIKVNKIRDDDIEAYCYLRHHIRHFKKENILGAMYTQ